MFVDYNQNARDRTTASAYSVRAAARRARVDAALVGRVLRSAIRATSRCARCRRCSPRVAMRTPGSMRRSARSTRCSRSPIGRRRKGRSAMAAALREDEDEAPRVAPSRAKASEKLPVITIAQAKLKADALAGLERWKARHPDVVAKLAPEHVLVDTNRGRATAWYRVRINLEERARGRAPARRASGSRLRSEVGVRALDLIDEPLEAAVCSTRTTKTAAPAPTLILWTAKGRLDVRAKPPRRSISRRRSSSRCN